MISRRVLREGRALVATIFLTTASVLMMYVRNNRFFYRDDVEHQHMGVFTALHRSGYGINSLGGFRQSWFLSLITGEVQFGVFNPLSWLRDYIAATGDNLARSAMLIALMYLLIAAVGAYVAARAVRISPAMAVAASLFCTFNVHLLYWDAGSWTPALIGFAWFTWFVAAVWWTRTNIRFAPFIPIAGYLLVSAGWPHAMIAGGVVALIVGLEQLFTRTWRTKEAAVYAMACIATALVSAPVWISAQVFADWAARAPHGLFNDGFLTHQLDALLLSFSPFVQPYVDGFAGQGFMFEPITYIAWILPLAAYWIITSKGIRHIVRTDVAVAAVVSVGMLGPSILGPTRWPFRFQPFAAFLVVMVAMRALNIASTHTDSHVRFEKSWRWIAPIVWLTLTALRPRLVPMLLTAVLFIAIPVAHRIFLSAKSQFFAPLLVVSIVLTTGWLMFASPSPAMPGDRNAPTSRSALTSQYASLQSQRVVVLQSNLAGAMTIERKRGRFRLVPNAPGAITASEMADGNILQATTLNAEFVTGYSAMPHEGLENLLQTRVFGWSSEGTAAALFSVETKTNMSWIDLMGVTAVMVQKGDQEQWFLASVTQDWKATTSSDYWTIYTRTSPLTSMAVSYTNGVTVSETASKISVKSENGGDVVLSRPITPGMSLSIAGKPAAFDALHGVLPVVHVPAGVSGELIVHYSLPHSGLIVLMIIAGVLAVLVLAILAIRTPKEI